jgi:hypothetical protein
MANAKPKTDREKILSPDHWPRWPILPLKRSASAKPNIGCIVGDPEGENVYFVPDMNMYGIDDDRIAVNGRSVNVDELIKEGWIVD